MSPEDRDDLELAGRAIFSFLWNENQTDETWRIRNLAKRAAVAEHRAIEPKKRRPRVLRNVTVIGGI